MKLIVKATNIKLTPSLKNFIEEKINSLEKFSKILQNEEKYFNHFFGKGKPRVEAWVEIGKTTLHHRKGPVFRVEVQLRFPKQSLRSEAVAKDLKLAITEVKDELQRQLKQYKEKVRAKTKRQSRVFKKELKISPQARLQPTHRPPASRAPFYRKGRIREEGI